MNRHVLKITSACAAASAVCYFLPYAYFFVQFGAGMNIPFVGPLPDFTIVGTMLAAFAFLVFVVLGLHKAYGDGSNLSRVSLVAGLYGSVAALLGTWAEFYGSLGPFGEPFMVTRYMGIALWLILVNLYMLRRKLWPTPISIFGFFASMPMLSVVLFLFIPFDIVYPWLIGLPPMWLILLSAVLALK